MYHFYVYFTNEVTKEIEFFETEAFVFNICFDTILGGKTMKE